MTDVENRFASYYENFLAVAERLKAQDWFNDEWKIVVKYYGEGNNRNPGFTMYKSNWFDGGIHFESWMGNADVKRSAVPISMHFETNYEKSRIKRGKFYAYLLEYGQAAIEQLEDYSISPKSYQFTINRVPYTDDTFIDVMVGEYEKLVALAAVIDAAIDTVQE